jgi:hypothetical protein
MEKKDCLKCGFLTIDGSELSLPTRTWLSTLDPRRNTPIANTEQTHCYKQLWESDIQFGTLDPETLISELNSDRSSCLKFVRHEPTFSPSEHQQRHDKREEESRIAKLQMKIAWLGFGGGLVGSVVGQGLVFLAAKYIKPLFG